MILEARFASKSYLIYLSRPKAVGKITFFLEIYQKNCNLLMFANTHPQVVRILAPIVFGMSKTQHRDRNSPEIADFHIFSKEKNLFVTRVGVTCWNFLLHCC